MINIMLDLETMGIARDAAIVSIGAVRFDLVSGKIEKQFQQAVTLESSMRHGGSVSAGTIMWWLEQSPQARASISMRPIALDVALRNFCNWLPSPGKFVVWGNGADFDNVVMSSAMDRLGIPRPWAFNQNRCYRTIKNLAPKVEYSNQDSHNSLSDAISQAIHLSKVLDYINKNGIDLTGGL